MDGVSPCQGGPDSSCRVFTTAISKFERDSDNINWEMVLEIVCYARLDEVNDQVWLVHETQAVVERTEVDETHIRVQPLVREYLTVSDPALTWFPLDLYTQINRVARVFPEYKGWQCGPTHFKTAKVDGVDTSMVDRATNKFVELAIRAGIQEANELRPSRPRRDSVLQGHDEERQ